MKPLMIGIAGGTGSGKSTFTSRLRETFGDDIAVVYHDNYYRSNDGVPVEQRSKINYDHPDSLETELLVEHLIKLRSGIAVQSPVYDFTVHNRSDKTIRIEPRSIIIVEGISDEDFYNFLLSAFKNMFEHTKPGGVIYCFHADTEGLNFRNAFKNAGFKLAECLIWVKNSLVLGRQDYQWRHEPCLYGWKEGAGHYFVDDRTQDTILEYDKPRNNNLHPTQKNIELVSKLILNSSRKDETILDLFGGSGTTLIAAEQLGRKTLMMELDEKYADVIVKRFITLKHSVDGCFLIRDGNKTSLSEIEDYKKVLDSEEVLS